MDNFYIIEQYYDKKRNDKKNMIKIHKQFNRISF
jgi:hypothetical protein